MAFQTRAALGILAQQVADETAPGANTADRVGTILQNMVDSTVNYRSFAGNITQFGTAAPVVDAAFSALPQGAIVWARTGTGVYTGTLAGAFLSGKVPYYGGVLPSSGTVEVNTYTVVRTNDNVVTLSTFANGAPSDSKLQSDFIEIRVYP